MFWKKICFRFLFLLLAFICGAVVAPHPINRAQTCDAGHRPQREQEGIDTSDAGEMMEMKARNETEQKSRSWALST